MHFCRLIFHLFIHIGFLWRSYYQQNQSEAFKDSKNKTKDTNLYIKISIVKNKKRISVWTFLLHLFNFILTNNAELLLPKAWAETRILFRSKHFISTKRNARPTWNMIIHLNYILIVLVKKITLVLHIFVESSKEKKLTTRCVYSNI